MKKYEEPNMDVLEFMLADVITLSPGADTDTDGEIGGGSWADPS